MQQRCGRDTAEVIITAQVPGNTLTLTDATGASTTVRGRGSWDVFVAAFEASSGAGKYAMDIGGTGMDYQPAFASDPDTQDMRTWLDKRGLGEYAKAFDRHRIDFEVLGDLTYDDVREIGISEVGPRRKVYRAIAQWRDERDAKKAEAIRGRMQVAEAARPENPGSPDVGDRLRALVREVSSLK